VLLLSGTAAYLTHSRVGQQRAIASAPGQQTTSLASIASGPRIVFRNTAIGPNYGRVAMVALDHPDGPRAFTPYSCDRVFAASGHMLCLASEMGGVSTYTAKTWPDVGHPVTNLPLTGSPSRARLSDDATLAATTSFVSGDSYAAASFSTRTVVTELATGTSVDLESFRLVHKGKAIRPVDRNFWGVTFAKDDDHFYATASFSGTAWLVRGSLHSRTLETLHADAECPSLSPDGTRVAYKKIGDRRPGDWRLAVLDLRTGKETALTEQRSVDDQVEWLDDDEVLYGMPEGGSNAAQTDVWVAAADGPAVPRLLIPKAWSPAVVR
jgi:hypothetical protein